LEVVINKFSEQYNRKIKAMGVDSLIIPTTFVKFYKNGETIPEELKNYFTENITLTSCQATKQASLGDAVLITPENVGCIAAAITFGLVDQNEKSPLAGPRVYTELMREQTEHKEKFNPPSPYDFTEGFVYACQATNKSQFALFGKEDSGRFASQEIAKKAIADMMAIQPAIIQAVFFCSPEFDDCLIEPDVVVCNIRPVELTRFVQAYQFNTGKRLIANMGGLRAVNSDLIVRPYLTGEINISSYCLGSRLIAQYDADRLGIGIPYKEYEILVKGMEDSQTGFPFSLYPGADH